MVQPHAARWDPGVDAFVALGVLSSAGSFETGRATQTKNRLMRTRVREAASVSDSALHHVAMRFVLATNNGKLSEPPPQTVLQEADQYRDMIFLNMTERFYLCSWKFVLWYRYALATFPVAKYLLIADPDAFVQLAHLEADLQAVEGLIHSGSASPLVYYGLIM